MTGGIEPLMRYLAIDYGLKRTGLAVCDADETLASPLVVLTGQSRLIEKIRQVAADQAVDAIVFGLPLNMDGAEGDQAKRVRDFAAELIKQIELPLFFQDERLSSFDAEKKLAALGITRKKKKKHLDAIAAAAILQAFIDAAKNA
ncbi:MAG: Holliday junction resolvase RuvX [Planctomycetota bacterium]|nr:MAG: Holliday junction resolvase RuvX [Planctomycetota bacterium]